MAEYMVFIWDDEQAWEHASPERVQATMAAHREFIARNASAVRGGSRLYPSAASTSPSDQTRPDAKPLSHTRPATPWAVPAMGTAQTPPDHREDHPPPLL